MKKLILSLFILTDILIVKPVIAQTFQGAEANRAHYKVLYFLDDAGPKKIKGTLRKIDNALEDVPSGNGETIIRQAGGWAVIHPLCCFFDI